MLDEINIFKNKQLRNCFLFFFFVAICGYASIMLSLCPYNDDYCRYLANMPVGTTYSGRYAALLLEYLFYFSRVVTDASPFTQILSCAFLAYIAVIFTKILLIDSKDKYSLLCLTPLVVNPYLLECMMYRFDNPFMTLSLLLVVLSAYLSGANDKKLLFIQVALLFQSLLIYQPASSAYFVICAYCLLVELSSGKKLTSVIINMRYRFYTPLITAVFYLPMSLCISHEKSDLQIFLLPTNLEEIRKIYGNICCYFNNLQSDWLCTTPGQMFFILLLIFSVSFLIDVFKNTTYKVAAVGRCMLVVSSLFVFIISPLGICLFLALLTKADGISVINPRMLYCFGVFISFVLYRNYLIFKKYKLINQLYVVFLTLLLVWNIVFLNSSGNVIRYYRKLHESVLYDLSKDIAQLKKENYNFSRIYVQGSVSSQATKNFFKLYPMLDRIVPDKWELPTYCMMGLFSHDIADLILKYSVTGPLFDDRKYAQKSLIKSHLWYDVYSLDNKVLLFELKEKHKIKDPTYPMLKMRDCN